jgi:DNA repair protein RecN (Recombination protein N)
MIEDGGAHLLRLEREETLARGAFEKAALDLSQGRSAAASRLDDAVAAELEPLRLGKAVFRTRVERLEEAAWGEHGCDAIGFEVSTNPGMPPGPLDRISSGGELARFMLALKVVLAGADAVPTLVFDEVDANVGGAVAAAVGERLVRLARNHQVLVVTHSPQVAARGEIHLRVEKRDDSGRALTAVDPLHLEARREEIARMLAGAHITDEARAAAESLLSGHGT